jgi:DNA end-binding protein Ku
MWKGVIAFEEVRLPVKLYAAAQDEDVHFRLLHADDVEPVEQRMLHPETHEVVSGEEIRKGVEIEPGSFAVLDDEALDAARPRPSRSIEVLYFVPNDAIARPFFRRPYYLGPDGDVQQEYFALASALAQEQRSGIARWTMRGKSYVGALRSLDGYLALLGMRYAGEVISSSRLEGPSGKDVSQRELEMAEQLVAMLAGDFRPGDFRSSYRERVRELIEAKARGQEVEVRRIESKRTTGDVAAALEKSLQRAKKERRRAS